MYTLNWLLCEGVCTQVEIDGRWVPCRPNCLEGAPADPFLWRLRDAWEVLRGRADAFTWPEGQ